MTFEARLERNYRVRFDEAGPDGMLPGSGYLRYAQDLAWLHSESAGFGRGWYRERGLTWLVRAIELDLIEDVEYGSEVGVSTEVVGFRRIWARRRSEFDPGGSQRTVAVALTDWVLLSAANRLVRPPQEIVDVFSAAAGGPADTTDFTPLRLALPDPPDTASLTEVAVRRSELDPLVHVNNAAYLDYVDELFLAVSGEVALPLPRRYRAEFVYPAEAGGVLSARTWQADDTWWFALDVDDRPSFRAALEISPSRWVGG